LKARLDYHGINLPRAGKLGLLLHFSSLVERRKAYKIARIHQRRAHAESRELEAKSIQHGLTVYKTLKTKEAGQAAVGINGSSVEKDGGGTCRTEEVLPTKRSLESVKIQKAEDVHHAAESAENQAPPKRRKTIAHFFRPVDKVAPAQTRAQQRQPSERHPEWVLYSTDYVGFFEMRCSYTPVEPKHRPAVDFKTDSLFRQCQGTTTDARIESLGAVNERKR
jgi:hypothetical protein